MTAFASFIAILCIWNTSIKIATGLEPILLCRKLSTGLLVAASHGIVCGCSCDSLWQLRCDSPFLVHEVIWYFLPELRGLHKFPVLWTGVLRALRLCSSQKLRLMYRTFGDASTMNRYWIVVRWSGSLIGSLLPDQRGWREGAVLEFWAQVLRLWNAWPDIVVIVAKGSLVSDEIHTNEITGSITTRHLWELRFCWRIQIRQRADHVDDVFGIKVWSFVVHASWLLIWITLKCSLVLAPRFIWHIIYSLDSIESLPASRNEITVRTSILLRRLIAQVPGALPKLNLAKLVLQLHLVARCGLLIHRRVLPRQLVPSDSRVNIMWSLLGPGQVWLLQARRASPFM